MKPGTRALLLALTTVAGGLTSSGPAAAHASVKPANSQLEHCVRALGTLRLAEPAQQPWLARLGSEFQMHSTLPLLRLIVRQSHCFILVEPARSNDAVKSEHSHSIFGTQLAEYTATPSLSFSEPAGGVPIGSLGGAAMRPPPPSALLTLTDNRAGVALLLAEGQASNWDFGAAGGFFNGGFAGAGAYTATTEGKLLVAAFIDSYNQLVRALKTRTLHTASAGSVTSPQALPGSE